MKIKDVIDFFGSKAAVARALAIGKSAVTQWEYHGEYVPKQRAYQIQVITNNELQVSSKNQSMTEALMSNNHQKGKKK